MEKLISRIDQQTERRVWEAKLIEKEKSEWGKVYHGTGFDVKIASLPSAVTSKLEQELKELGLVLRSVPLPNSKQYDYDSNVSLLAVETIAKPDTEQEYDTTPILHRLGFSKYRRGLFFIEIMDNIKQHEVKILQTLNLERQNAHFGILNWRQWTLLAKREGWDKNNSYEWTNSDHEVTYLPTLSVPYKIITGNFLDPVSRYERKHRESYLFLHKSENGYTTGYTPEIGFRIALFFNP